MDRIDFKVDYIKKRLIEKEVGYKKWYVRLIQYIIYILLIISALSLVVMIKNFLFRTEESYDLYGHFNFHILIFPSLTTYFTCTIVILVLLFARYFFARWNLTNKYNEELYIENGKLYFKFLIEYYSITWNTVEFKLDDIKNIEYDEKRRSIIIYVDLYSSPVFDKSKVWYEDKIIFVDYYEPNLYDVLNSYVNKRQ